MRFLKSFVKCKCPLAANGVLMDTSDNKRQIKVPTGEKIHF